MAGAASVYEAVMDIAVRNPDALALTGAASSWTYRALRADVDDLAGGLLAQGCGPGSSIGVVAENHPVSALLWLAAARSGTIISQLNFMFTADELAVPLENLQPRVVFCDAGRLELCRLAAARAGLAPTIVLLEDAATAPLDPLHPMPAAGDLFEIAYTSGTTSGPKGVALTHAAVLFRGRHEAALFGFGPADTSLMVTPLFHQSGLRNSAFPLWLAGGHAVIAPRFVAGEFWHLVHRHGVTYCCTVETILLMLMRSPPPETAVPSTLRRVLGGGDAAFIAAFEQRFGLRVCNVWGMTENGVATAVPLDRAIEEVRALRRWGNGANLAGWPLPGNEIRLVGDDGTVHSGEGASGEIWIRSPALLREYYRNPAATNAAFSDGWFKTGDLGMYGPGGALYFVDRLKDVIRRGGENIASKQVEEVLNAYPDIRACAVIPVPDALFIQEVKALVVLRDGAAADAEAIWRWCDERLARYKVPRYIEFRDSLPAGGSGRIQKQVLRAEGIAGRGRLHDRRAEVTA